MKPGEKKSGKGVIKCADAATHLSCLISNKSAQIKFVIIQHNFLLLAIDLGQIQSRNQRRAPRMLIPWLGQRSDLRQGWFMRAATLYCLPELWLSQGLPLLLRSQTSLKTPTVHIFLLREINNVWNSNERTNVSQGILHFIFSGI